MIHSILPVLTACLAIFLHNLSPCPFWSTSWSRALHLIFHTFLHPISVFFSQHMPIPLQPVLLYQNPITNQPNSAQLGSTAYHSTNLHLGPCSSVGTRPRTDTQMRMTTIHFASSTTQAKCNEREQLKPNSITLASLELAPKMFKAGSCQIPLH